MPGGDNNTKIDKKFKIFTLVSNELAGYSSDSDVDIKTIHMDFWFFEDFEVSSWIDQQKYYASHATINNRFSFQTFSSANVYSFYHG